MEDTLNTLLYAEAGQICGAQRFVGRAGRYERTLETKAGVVRIRVPKLRRLPFETAIIERHKRRESSAEEALVERYVAGASVRRAVSGLQIPQLHDQVYRAPLHYRYAFHAWNEVLVPLLHIADRRQLEHDDWRAKFLYT